MTDPSHGEVPLSWIRSRARLNQRRDRATEAKEHVPNVIAHRAKPNTRMLVFPQAELPTLRISTTELCALADGRATRRPRNSMLADEWIHQPLVPQFKCG